MRGKTTVTDFNLIELIIFRQPTRRNRPKPKLDCVYRLVYIELVCHLLLTSVGDTLLNFVYLTTIVQSLSHEVFAIYFHLCVCVSCRAFHSRIHDSWRFCSIKSYLLDPRWCKPVFVLFLLRIVATEKHLSVFGHHPAAEQPPGQRMTSRVSFYVLRTIPIVSEWLTIRTKTPNEKSLATHRYIFQFEKSNWVTHTIKVFPLFPFQFSNGLPIEKYIQMTLVNDPDRSNAFHSPVNLSGRWWLSRQVVGLLIPVLADDRFSQGLIISVYYRLFAELLFGSRSTIGSINQVVFLDWKSTRMITFWII